MGFLKKIRSNILNQQNSFHVGFGNRSPFSYRGKYAGDWTPEVPNLAASAYGQPETDLGETDLLKAQIDTIGKVRDAVTGVAEAHIKNEAKKDCEASGGTWKDGKCYSGGTLPKSDPMKPKVDVEKNPVGNAKGQVKPGGIAHQHLDPEGYDAWAKGKELLKKEKEEKAKEAKRKWELENAGVPDFTNFTGTSSDWH
jgi:hypothetical protein